jgi:hypothetical protein
MPFSMPQQFHPYAFWRWPSQKGRYIDLEKRPEMDQR